ncbi:MAG: translocation/assembly module TamB domain-containing protein [Crocinitomicaceae bacterium]|nr:translocation/assembly module TamB domain-containing protein [Crocinitomicaceae bacterium]
MAKLLKILGRTLGLLIEWILIFVIFLAFVIRTSTVQTYLAEKVTNYLTDELGAEFHIDRVDIVFFDQLSLEGILIEDEAGDTIVAAESILATIKSLDLGKREFNFGDVEFNSPDIHIQRDTEGVFSHNFIREYFKSDKKKRTVQLSAERVFLNNGHFRYDDHRKARQANCVDYFHIDVKEINGEVDDFVMHGRVYSGTVLTLSCLEKSGFKLKDIYTESVVTENGIFLTNTEILSPASIIKADTFNMLSTGFTDFKHFVDSVEFDGKIDESTIDLSEAALFAPIFAGMNDTIQLKTVISNKTKNLKLSDLDLRIKNNCRIKGDLNFPDYRSFSSGFFHENLDYVKLDLVELQDIKLPYRLPISYVELDQRAERLKFVEAKNVRFDGFLSQFVVASDMVHTALGDIRIDNGLMFTENEANNSFLFERSGASEYDFKVEQFNLGRLLADENMGVIDGIFFISGEAFSSDNIVFTSIEGNVNQFDYLNYPYSDIAIIDGTYQNDVFEGTIDVADDNLDMTYSGSIDFKGELHLDFTIDVNNALLDKLGVSNVNSQLSSVFKVDLYGRNPNDFRGTVVMDEFSFTEEGKTFKVPSLTLEITRGVDEDIFSIESDIASGSMTGKLDFNYIIQDINYNLSEIFPSLYPEELKERNAEKHDHFDFDFEVNKAQEFLAIFFPTIQVAPKTRFKGHYYAEQADMKIELTSRSISYLDMKFSDVQLNQVIADNSLIVNYQASEFVYNDSLRFPNVYFKSLGQNDLLISDLEWKDENSEASTITWETEILDKDHWDFTLDPSYFYVQDKKWEIAHLSKISVHSDTLHVQDFELIRNNQEISLNGYLSNEDKHRLNFNVRNFEIEEVSSFLSPVPLEGRMNASGYVSNPLNNFQYVADANIHGFKTKGRLVGDITMNSEWVKRSKSIALQGDLKYKGNQTFDFIGDYYPMRTEEKLDFNLFFDHTDIQFVNAFMNPEVMSEIKGLLNGTLKVTGDPDEPILDGTVRLVAGSAKVDLLGAYFGIDGPIEADKYGFYINGIPVFDEEGNAGMLIGSIYHDNFEDFNFDLLFDLEIDAINKDPLRPWMSIPLDRFMVLNSEYEPGDLYYGRGYATGLVEVFGYTDNLEVTVDIETQEGTEINIPMYGIGEIEDESFIIFKDKDTTAIAEEPKIDFTGVDLDLNFRITPEADVKIIFNEDLGDEISAHGSGDIDINLNNIGDVTMNGVFNVDNGVYDFAMGPIKEKFYIERGGSISWTGNPYDAILNLRTFYKVNANIASATNDQFGSGTGAHQEVLCYLDLTESLLKPTIGFDLAAPRADEIAKSVITRIKSDPDELNRQFFSLLLWKRFQPLAGTVLADGSAAIDLVTNQINALLAKVSDDYTLNVNMDADQLTGDNTYEFGVSTGFLNDRLILSGSFGVESHKVDESEQNSIIGDLNLEYLLNESGSFRINIFNESNDKTIIQNEDLGAFTQGGGLYYKEDFHTLKDFKVLQYFLDIFRKKGNKRYPIKRKRKQVPVPQSNP